MDRERDVEGRARADDAFDVDFAVVRLGFFCAMASPSPVPPEGEERPSWLVEVQGEELGEVGVVLDDEDLLAHNISRVRSGRLQAW